MLISSAFAQATTAPGASTSDFFIQMVPYFVFIPLIFYFLLIRPRQQQEKAHQAMVGAIKRGDVVVTGGGIIGKVVKVLDNDEFLIEIAEEVRIRVIKGTIVDVRSKTEPVEAKPKSDDDKK